MTVSGPVVETITETNRSDAEKFLLAHENTSQFLINNIREHGPCLTPHHNSGNFKLIRQGSNITAVFCLTRRGNLIVQSKGDYSELILKTCEKENVQLKGFMGELKSVIPIWKYFKSKHPEFKPSHESKEILYSFVLHSDDLKLKHDNRVRFLEPSDFDQWLKHSIAYMKELGLPDDTNVEQKRADFLKMIHDRILWGLFSGDILLSRTALNSNGTTVGQVGGVFTPPEHRQKGVAKATMFHMLKDCRDLHGHTKSILFTGETDTPAQKLYESLGYKQAGFFALILGE